MTGIMPIFTSNITSVLVGALISWITTQYFSRKELIESKKRELHELDNAIKNNIFSIKCYIDAEIFYLEQEYLLQCENKFVMSELLSKNNALKSQFDVSLKELEKLIILNPSTLKKDFIVHGLDLVKELKYKIFDVYTDSAIHPYDFFNKLGKKIDAILKIQVI